MTVTRLIATSILGFILLFPSLLFASNDYIGTATFNTRPVWVVRDGVQLSVGSFGTKVKLGDVIKTGETGKAQVNLDNGNEIFVAASTEIEVSQDLVGEADSKITQVFKLFYGKIRAKIQKTRKQRFKIKTATAVIGVKGTDFITEFKDDITKVGTIEGLVNLMSEKSQESLDIPPGSMSSVSAAGELLPLEEFAGELMDGVEFAGEKMEANDMAGEKMEM